MNPWPKRQRALSCGRIVPNLEPGWVMRVYCRECGGKCRISSRNDISKEFVSLYCDCQDCGHRFVSHLTFSHTLRPSEQMMDRLVFDRLSSMSRTRQQEIFQQLGVNDAR